ncbi:MAG: glycosyltransferase [Pseudomonadota bacterium]
MKTSIIICFYERIEHLKCGLDALKRCAKSFHEVIVADDGSGVDTVRSIQRLIPNYDFSIVHAWHERKGARRSASRNNGIRHATGDYLIFFDADHLVLPGTIDAHLKAARPARFVAGNHKCLTEEQTRQVFDASPSTALIEALYRELPEEPIIKEHRRFVRYSILRRLRLVSARKVQFAGHFSIYREDIERVNGYDENFVGWGGEDLDLSIRLVKAGFHGDSVIRQARVLHLWHPKELGNKHWKEGGNVQYFFRKHIPYFCENGLVKDAGANQHCA